MSIIINGSTTIAAPTLVGPVQPLLLDTYPNATGAYSLRKLTNSYSGFCIRVRRSSDNATQDIGFDSSGNLDESSLLTFVGANSGFVTTWYDQSGNSRHVSNATTSQQPKIITSGTIERQNGKATIVFDGLANYLDFTGNSVNTDLVSIFFVASEFIKQNNGGFYVIKPTAGLDYQSNSSIILETSDNVNELSFTQNVTNVNLLQLGSGGTAYGLRSILKNNTSAQLYFNTVQSATISGTYSNGTSNNGTIIGARYSSGTITNFLNGKIQEIIHYNSDQTANRNLIETNINQYYSILPVLSPALLDTYTGAEVAYSIRALTSTLKTPLCKIRRSNDNALLAVYPNSSGQIDEAAVLSFIGSNSGFITQLYDQIGIKHLVQSTLANQPQIINAGSFIKEGTRPCIQFDGSNDHLITNVTLNVSTSLSLFAKTRKITHVNNEGFFSLLPNLSTNNRDWASANGRAFAMNVSSTLFGIDAHNIYLGSNGFTNPIALTRTITLNTPFIVNFYEVGGTATININNANTATDTYNGTPTAPTGIIVGARYDAGINGYGNMTLSELIVYGTDQSANGSIIVSNMNTFYSVY